MKSRIRISDPKGLMQIEDMDIYAKEGYKVTVTEQGIQNGYSRDVEKAKKYLEVGKVYTVKETEVGAWRTEVVLKELPDIRFNSVHFVPFKNN